MFLVRTFHPLMQFLKAGVESRFWIHKLLLSDKSKKGHTEGAQPLN